MPTVKQVRLLDFVTAYSAEHGGVSPSYQEIAAGIGISPKSKSTIYRLVKTLEADGLVSYRKNGKRSLQSLAPQRANNIPLRPELGALLLKYADDNRTSASAILNEAVAAYLGLDAPTMVSPTHGEN